MKYPACLPAHEPPQNPRQDLTLIPTQDAGHSHLKRQTNTAHTCQHTPAPHEPEATNQSATQHKHTKERQE